MVTATTVPGWLPLHFRRAPELATPPDDRAVEQAALGQILQQRRHPLVQFGEHAAHGLEMLLVRIPTVVVDRHVADTFFDQPARHQARLAEGRATVLLAQVVRSPGTDQRPCRHRPESDRTPRSRTSAAPPVGIALHGVRQRIQIAQQVAARPLPLVRRCRAPPHLPPQNAVAPGSPPVANGLYLDPRNPASEKRPCGWVSTM